MRYKQNAGGSSPDELTMSDMLHAIIVTHNAERWISAAIESLRRSTIPVAIIVVDNASTDKTLAIVEASRAEVSVLVMPCNLGFAAANNAGLRHALAQGAQFVFLLNQDARVAPDTIAQLVAALKDHPGFGIMSPLQLDYKGQALDKIFLQHIQINQAVLSDALLGQMRKIYDLPFMNAAAWMIRRSLLEAVGGFDPIFFMYGEDNDYCARARYHGFKVGITPDARFFHWHGFAESLNSSLEHMTRMLHTQAINMLKRPDRAVARNVPGFVITWARKCLHACIEGEAKECAAVALSFLKTLKSLPEVRQHQKICSKPGPSWLYDAGLQKPAGQSFEQPPCRIHHKKY